MIYFIKLPNFILKENFMKKLLLISIAAAVAFCGESLLVGAGGGYKKPVSEVIENLKKTACRSKARLQIWVR